MVGKLHKSWPGGHVYMLVAVDKFTLWVEAAPVTTQDSTAAINFIKSIVFRFGVPHSIITDNGTNFTSKECGDPAYHCMCSMQVVDITPMKHRLTSITSIRVVQQKHRRSKVGA
jgi:transposase-like protein